MRHALLLGLVTLCIAGTLGWAPPADAAGPQWVIVAPGETLYSIAVRNGTTVDALMRANNLPNANFVYAGQRLLIPHGIPVNAAPAPAQPAAPAPNNVYYTVRPGDTLAAIAARYGTLAAAIARANGLTNWNFVWYGQRLLIPNATLPAPPPPPAQPSNNPAPAAPPIANAPTDGKWIDVNLAQQTITAYEGRAPIKTVLVSTGTVYHPTVVGTFTILRKYSAVRMTGGTPGVDYYDLPNVPWTMFFYRGYALHGTYWHNNFGRPMSHGCVNLPTDAAKWFYDWAPVGTTVVVHR